MKQTLLLTSDSRNTKTFSKIGASNAVLPITTWVGIHGLLASEPTDQPSQQTVAHWRTTLGNHC